MRRSDFSSLSVFVAVATGGGFRHASRALGLSPSAVSHAIAGLEGRIGTRLLARTTRSVTLTDAGRRLLAQLQPALQDIDRALAGAAEARDVPTGLLRLSVPRSVSRHVLFPRLAAFAADCPEVTVEIRADDAMVDIVADGFDAGIRLGESLQKDMVAVRIGPRQRMIMVAAPCLLAGRAPPAHPRDLSGWPCVAVRLAGGGLYGWDIEKDGEAVSVLARGPLVANDLRIALDAAVAGMGVAFVMEGLAAAALARGDVVRVLDGWSREFSGFHLYYPSRRQMRPALRAFIDAFAVR